MSGALAKAMGWPAAPESVRNHGLLKNDFNPMTSNMTGRPSGVKRCTDSPHVAGGHRLVSHINFGTFWCLFFKVDHYGRYIYLIIQVH